MGKKIFYLLCILFAWQVSVYAQPQHNKKVVGYYAQWSIYARDYNITNINGNKLTHLMYAFFGTQYDPANPQNTKLKSLDTYADFEHMEGGIPWDANPKGNFYDLKKLKQNYPHLKILISVGGWTKSQNFSAIAASPVARTALAQDMANFLVQYPFIDGFDIDWEFPVLGGTDGTEVIGGSIVPAQPHLPDDNKNLVYLLKAMREAMPNKLVSIAAGNSVVNITQQFIGPSNRSQYGMVEDISTYCDFITFFGYDFGGNWYDKTCYNAPLYGSGNTNDPLHGTPVQSMEVLVNKFINNIGFPKEKLIMGVPFYGKLFNNVANNGSIPNLPGLFVSAPRNTGICTNPQPPQGTWDNASCEYSGSIEFCDLAGNVGTNGHHFLDTANSQILKPVSVSAGWSRYWDETAKVPYLFNPTSHQFITYEDKKSIDEKAKFINLQNLGGAMVWELSQDTRATDPEPAALLTQINATFSNVSPPPAAVTVKLNFKDQQNNPISGVAVVLTKTSNNTTVSATSDATGTVQFPNTATGLAYTISYTKNSYTFSPQATSIATGSLTADVTYNITGSTQTNSTYSISGFVKNGTTPLSGVSVILTSNGVTTTSVTNASGTYTFSNLASGQNYTVAATGSGQSFLPSSTAFNNLSANQTQDFSLVVASNYLISGTVRNGNTPVQGVKVELILPYASPGIEWVALQAITDAQGKYHFENSVLSGRTIYSSLKINAWENNNVNYLPASYPQANIPTTPQVFDFNTQAVVVASPVVAITAPTTPTVSLNLGSVLTLSATVGLSQSGTTTTISSVVFAIDGQTITATNTSGNVYSASWTPVANQFSANHIFTVTATASNGTTDVKSQSFTLNCSGANCPGQVVSISGAVKNGNNLIPNVTVKLLNANNDVVNTISSTDGNFTFSNVPSGATYKVTAEKPSYTFIATTLNNVTANQTGVIVSGTQVITTYSISGFVKNGTTPLSGVSVVLTSNGVATTSVTNASGAYTFSNLASGQNYTVAATGSGQSFLPSSTAFNNLSANQTQDFSLVIASNYLISGTVRNGNTPVQGVKVELILPYASPGIEWVALQAITDAQGKYHFENSVLSGRTIYSSLKINAWENNNVNYLPASYPQANIPTTPQVFDFNTQAVVVTSPVVAITAPTTPTVSLNLGSVLTLSTTVGLSPSGTSTTLSSVVFTIDGQTISAANISGNVYSASWTPAANQFSANHTFTVTATASNGTTDVKSQSFTLNCTGANCPNQLPIVTWNSPTNTTIYQSSFQAVPISVTAIDNDGSISNVKISINGGTQFTMTAGANNTYTYSFTPTAYQDYAIVIKATDNASGVTTYNNTIKIAQPNSNRFVPLPSKVILGYAHSWENAEATFMYFNQMVGTKFNVVAYAFVETQNSDGFTPVLTTNDNRYLTNGVFNKQLLKNDIQTLRSSGVPVIVSIGGQNGHVLLENTNQKNIFVNGLKAIIDEYQFDGVDIDFEGGSMNFGAAGLTNFSYASISPYPRLKNVVDAFKELKQYYGPGFILTAAPETFYVQVGYQSYGGTAGAFLPVLHNLRNELDLLMVQLYNSGPVGGLDNQNYFSATPNFITSMTDMLIKGFNVGTTGFHFDGLPASKVVVALPACPRAAGTGYLPAADGVKAINYLRFGTDFPGRTYSLQPGGPHPNLRGAMTWSVNWDAAASCASSYEFANAYHACFFGNQSNRSQLNVSAFISDNILSIDSKDAAIAHVKVYNFYGQLVADQKNDQNDGNMKIEIDNSTTKQQLFIVEVYDEQGNRIALKTYSGL